MTTNTVEHARKIAAELESKLAAVGEKVMDLATERRRLAYDASIGNAKAKSKLETLNADSAAALIEHENATVAAHEGRHRLSEAESQAVIAEQRAAAEKLRGQVRELAEKVEARGPSIAAALATFCAEYASLEADLTALRQLGVEIAPARSVGLSFEAVLSHSVRSVGLHVGDLVEPGRRHSPEFLTDSYASRARTWGDAALNERAAA
jgi:hypothetical protein